MTKMLKILISAISKMGLYTQVSFKSSLTIQLQSKTIKLLLPPFRGEFPPLFADFFAFSKSQKGHKNARSVAPHYTQFWQV